MSKRIARLSAAAAGAALLAASALPAAAADYFSGYDGGYGGGDRPLSYHSRDDVYVDGGRARVEHRQNLRPAEGYRRGPGPVVFDERAPDHRYDGYGYGRPAGFIPRVGRPYGGEGPYGGPYGGGPYGVGPYGVGPYGVGPYGDGGYRPAAVAVGPAYGGGYGPGPGYGGPDEGCTVERARSYTPAGWEKTVTHRTCYRR